MRQTAARLAASLGGLGHLKPAPGTIASLAATLLGAALLRHGRAPLAAAAAGATLVGLAATAGSGAAATDPGWIVIDELAGQWLALTALARPTLPGLVAGFVLFRALDIGKPGPIGRIDRRRDAIGVMGDDLAAGAAAAALLWWAGRHWPTLLQ